MAAVMKCRDVVAVEKLTCQAIVGVKEPERLQRQNVVISLEMYLDTSPCSLDDDIHLTTSYATVAREVLKYTEESKHYLLETLAHGIARVVCLKYKVPECKVRVEKPRAIPLAQHAVVEIVRTLEFFQEEAAREALHLQQRGGQDQLSPGEAVVYLGLGSNLGDRVSALYKAVEELGKSVGRVIATSGMFETPATYVTDQPDFLNACVAVATTKDPFDLLRSVKAIEQSMGRNIDSGPTKGPRPVDIDVLLHGDTELKSAKPHLVIPHQEMHRRLFVLLPLCDIIPPGLSHPTIKKPFKTLRDSLLGTVTGRVPGEENAGQLCRVVPLHSARGTPGTLHIAHKTTVVGIIEASGKKGEALEKAARILKSGADAVAVHGEDDSNLEAAIVEIREGGIVAPVIAEVSNAAVARRVLECGASMVHAVLVSSFQQLGEIVAVANSFQAAVAVQALPALVEPEEELQRLIPALEEEHNVRRWQIIYDAGLGSHPARNADLLRNGRKRFSRIPFPSLWTLRDGMQLECRARDGRCERVTGDTAAMVTLAVQQGANIVAVEEPAVQAAVAASRSAMALFA